MSLMSLQVVELTWHQSFLKKRRVNVDSSRASCCFFFIHPRRRARSRVSQTNKTNKNDTANLEEYFAMEEVELPARVI